jgi:signal transduction histidine kinase
MVVKPVSQDIPGARVAEFVRQHVHDLRNFLNSIDLEVGLLQELAQDDGAQASAERVHKQVHGLADRLRSLSLVFRDAEPLRATVAARELLLGWRQQQATLPDAPQVQWKDELDDAKVNVDVEMMASVVRELLANAAAFSQGGPPGVAVRRRDHAVILELREPKAEALDPSAWARPFSAVRAGHYGLGLWSAHRLAQANGATLEQHYSPDDRQLITRLSLPVTSG